MTLVPMTQSMVHWLSFLGTYLVATNYCFGDALYHNLALVNVDRFLTLAHILYFQHIKFKNVILFTCQYFLMFSVLGVKDCVVIALHCVIYFKY